MTIPRRLVLSSMAAAGSLVAASAHAFGPLASFRPGRASMALPMFGPPAPSFPAQPSPAQPSSVTAQSLGLPAQPAQGLPTWRRNAVASPLIDGRPAITVVVDDMGWMHPHTERVVAMPGPLTLAWFPFSLHLPEQVAVAAARGHEAMLHMPMQATWTNSIAQTGPDPLRVDLTPAVNLARLRAALDAVPDIVGLNNHMGTLATRDLQLMEMVAVETRARDMLFLDSIVISHSVGLSCAEAAGVPAAGRDMFIDYKMDAATIRSQLELIEAMSRRHGHCIAIGHPRSLTIEALEAWLPTLDAKGFALWPVSATVAWRNNLALPGPRTT